MAGTRRTGCLVATVLNKGYIQSLNREGPILRKSIPIPVAYSLVNRGYKIYEHHPIDQKIKVLLTRENFDDEHKFDALMGVGKEEKVEIVDPNKNLATPEQAKAAEAVLNSPVRTKTTVEEKTEEKVEEKIEEKVEESAKIEESTSEDNTSNTQNLSRKQRRELRRQQMMAEQNAQKEASEAPVENAEPAESKTESESNAQ